MPLKRHILGYSWYIWFTLVFIIGFNVSILLFPPTALEKGFREFEIGLTTIVLACTIIMSVVGWLYSHLSSIGKRERNEILLKVVGVSLITILAFGSGIGTEIIYVFSTTDIAPPATIIITVSTTTPKVNQSVIFSCENSSFGMLGINIAHVNVYWDFDNTDGVQPEASGITVNHSFLSLCVYNVSVIIVRSNFLPPKVYSNSIKIQVLP